MSRREWMARHARRGALALTAMALMAGGPGAASAEGFLDGLQPSPRDVQMSLTRSGFGMRSALVQRGDVYVCDVFGRYGDPERLVISVRSGAILERYAGRLPAPEMARYAATPRYPGPGDHADPDVGPRRPPRVISLEGPRSSRAAVNDQDGPAAPPRAAPAPRRLAKSDGTFLGLFAPPEPIPTVEATKPKAHIRKPKPTPTASPDAATGTPPEAASPVPVTPAALTLRHAPIADCARYDNLRRPI